MNISITGASGFIGSFLYNKIQDTTQNVAFKIGKNILDFKNEILNSDYLIHCASVHRSTNPMSVYVQNININFELLKFLVENEKKINIIFLSSIMEDGISPYGLSKSTGKKLFQDYCTMAETNLISYKLPNIFGPGAIPNKTSVVATFCYNIINGIESKINNNKLTLSFIDDVAASILSFDSKFNFPTYDTTVPDLYDSLIKIKNEIAENKFPVRSEFEQKLFITYLSYLNLKI